MKSAPAWMSANLLMLNPSNSNVLLMGNRQPTKVTNPSLFVYMRMSLYLLLLLLLTYV
jgi:hypothetical protein